jgi:hypothetical protein
MLHLLTQAINNPRSVRMVFLDIVDDGAYRKGRGMFQQHRVMQILAVQWSGKVHSAFGSCG